MTEQTPSSQETAPTPAKADPETLVLRGTPQRVVRFRREIIIGGAALGSLVISGTAWRALRSPHPGIFAQDSDKVEAASPPEEVNNAPSTYGDGPKLGAPLPGDLGGPILEHERSLGAMQRPPADPVRDQAAQRAEAEHERIAAQRKAAREAGVMIQLGQGAQPPAAAPATTAVAEPAYADGSAGAIPVAGPESDPNGQAHKAAFLAQDNAGSDVSAFRLTPAPSPYTLSAGSVIAASLITGLDSDLPGLVTAQVTQNVYDSLTGRILLIPQGSRLIGRYDSVVAFGQQRALVAWERIILPDGSSIRLDDLPASDPEGYSGLADKNDRHSWQLLKGAVLSTLLGVGTQLSLNNESDLVRAIRQSAQQSGANAGDQLVSKSLGIQPTIRVRPGWPLRVVVHKDIVLRPWHPAGG
ncbi:TrbI/VirB10 family protein [Novosphingobium malaysiense]|uniref:Conjugal transfer protein TrbI n=1 Tax=Novosphingobium malaysiense TaxID=1348853 RepID=A0A0B1ZL92_9SPHN|nr:TrbI/VirB10 family protein [Novosphingobium malaysiense]KHK91875.1 conjugal transfer protein TrbI [Novosphingobium malaysiense]